MPLESISDFVLLTFVTVSLPFYILFLLTILRNRRKEPFNSSFFTLCFSLGIADVAALVHSYVFIKIPGWSWGHQFWIEYGYRGSFLAFYGHVMLWAISLSQHIGVLLIGINRFTAIAFTFRQEEIWRKRNIIIAIVVQWTVPILFVAPTVMTEFEYDYWGGKGDAKYSDNVNIDFSDKNYEEVYYIAAVIINLIVNATTCIMYIAVLVKTLQLIRKRKVASGGILQGARDPTKTNDDEQSDHEAKHGSQSSSPPQNRIQAGLTVPVETPRVTSSSRNSIVQGKGSPQKAMLHVKAMLNSRRKSQRVVELISQKVAFNRELRLTVCGFLMFACMLIYFLFLIAVATEGDGGFDVGWLWNVASDLFNCISPYTLFIMSTQTRVELKRTLLCRKI